MAITYVNNNINMIFSDISVIVLPQIYPPSLPQLVNIPGVKVL